MHRLVLAVIMVSLHFTAKVSESAVPPQGNVPDVAAIEEEIGLKGETKGEVHRITLPRTDLDVTVDGVKIHPAFALGSWITFKPAGHQAVVYGDLVLTEGEVRLVVTELERQGLQITALHNHLIHESPRLMYLHFWGNGETSRLARALRAAVGHTKTPVVQARAGNQDQSLPETDTILKILGHKGDVRSGILKVSIPRPEIVKAGGVELPPSMGMATTLNFQAGQGGNVLATGDFVMTAEEVNSVARALAERGITVTALHNHLLEGSPDLYFMHFWANDTTERVAQGLRAGIEAMSAVGKTK